MSEYLTTSRGDRVAYDLRGSGPALLFIAGAGPYRAIDPVTTETAELAAQQGITTIVYDRLGRGESRVEGRIDLDRELEAVAVLLERAGGSALLCGHSSGCSIALAAAVRGLAVDGLALFEAPLGEQDSGGREWAAEVDRRIDAGDLEGAMRYYMKDMPPEFFEAWRQSPEFPDLVAQAGSLRADGESLVWAESAPHTELFGKIEVPVLAMVGAETFPEMYTAADSIVAAIAGARQQRVPGAQHTWVAEPMAELLVEFVFASR
ncbi:alpha/beta hydrolase [Nocardia sp. NPDC048505]|uniref:alpha/beta fold hydrolase n=1 Tax=unclassified Nocardia TaxID=2637762 RepID=UPI0033DCB66F